MPVLLLAAAVGCRNWLFADTSRGAKASATIYSLIETAKVNELEPYDYLHPVLKHIAAPTPLRGSKRCCRGTCRVNKRKKAESLALKAQIPPHGIYKKAHIQRRVGGWRP